MNPDSIRSICVVRFSALGDLALVLPAVRALQQAFPGAHLTWLTSPLGASLLQGLTGVELLVCDKPAGPGDYWRIHRQLAGRSFDVLLAMQASLRINLIYPLIRARRKIGFDRQRARDGQGWFCSENIPFSREHLLDSFMAFARQLGAAASTVRWDLPVSDAARAWAQQQLAARPGPFLALNAAASKPERNWPVERYVALLQQACARWSLTPVLTGGPGALDRQLGEAIKQKLGMPVIDCIGRTQPQQLAAVLQRMAVLVAPDTGPAHIAVAVGTPVVGLYAVAPSELSRPYLYPDLVVDRFPDAVRRFLGKDPASVPWGTRVHDARAMGLIEVDDVLAKLQLLFDRRA